MAAEACETLTITCRKKKTEAPYHEGDTIFEAARRMGLRPPCSCLAGTCGTCMARLVAGSVSMKHNEVLTPEEIDEGLILTCQSLPTSARVVVDYEN
jgi:3-ketosteroid 9alpha-monooxygenase subunit B